MSRSRPLSATSDDPKTLDPRLRGDDGRLLSREEIRQRMLAEKVREFRDLILRACKAEGFANDAFFAGKQRELELLTAEHSCDRPGRYTVAVKVVDIFGSDTMTLIPVNVG